MKVGETVSHYRVIELLGAGGMGVVYKAEDLRLKRAVALKFLPFSHLQDAEAKERLIQEAQAASALITRTSARFTKSRKRPKASSSSPWRTTRARR